jgi:hypothetical protein
MSFSGFGGIGDGGFRCALWFVGGFRGTSLGHALFGVRLALRPFLGCEAVEFVLGGYGVWRDAFKRFGGVGFLPYRFGYNFLKTRMLCALRVQYWHTSGRGWE